MTSAPRIVESLWAMTKLVRLARGLVEDEHARIVEERPSDGHELLLTGADVVALVVYDRVVAVGERVHEAVDVGDPRRFEDLFLGGFGVAVREVLADGAPEEPGVLEDHRLRGH